MLLEERKEQIVPTLSPAQIHFALRFASGPKKRFEAGEALQNVGDRDLCVWLIVGGSITANRRDGLGRESIFAVGAEGQFTGEIADLTGQASLATIIAGPDGCEAYPFDQAHLRALIVGSADIGELMMRAFILRRAAFLEGDTAGSVIIGELDAPETVRLSGLLTRNGYPWSVIDIHGEEGKSLVEQLAVQTEDLPILVSPNGSVLRRPTDAEAGIGLGITPNIEDGATFDVVIIGAGPAGLAAAVYAASEGLTVLVVDGRSFGGQAGASARIENYLGFPTGISGMALTARAFVQAQKFGAQFAIPISAVELDCSNPGVSRLVLDSGVSIFGRSVVIASGARYRRPDIEGLERFEGTSVSYWATPIEANLVEGRDVVIVGGGNSAGQAIVYLSGFARKVHVITRSAGFEASMSRYLIDRISATSNVEVHTFTTIAQLVGQADGTLEYVILAPTKERDALKVDAQHMFLFTGADPNTQWLHDCVELDEKGFIRTGQHPVRALETSKPGVFAIGDVRAGSTKRVAAGVGEGAAAVAQIHAFLAELTSV